MDRCYKVILLWGHVMFWGKCVQIYNGSWSKTPHHLLKHGLMRLSVELEHFCPHWWCDNWQHQRDEFRNWTNPQRPKTYNSVLQITSENTTDAKLKMASCITVAAHQHIPSLGYYLISYMISINQQPLTPKSLLSGTKYDQFI